MIKILFGGGFLALAMQAQTVTVTANPASLTFTYQASSGTLPAAQTVAIKGTPGTPAFTTAISPSSVLWVTASLDSGKLPASLMIRVNPTGLAVGTYTQPAVSVMVTVVGAAAPLSIPVTLTVTAPPSSLTLSPGTLNFTSPSASGFIQNVVMSTNSAPISYTVTSGATWLTASPLIGVVLPGAQTGLAVTVDPTSLAPQAAPYVGKLTVVASGAAITVKSQTITVNLTVNSLAATITSVWPASLPVNAGAQAVTLRGTDFYKASLVKVQGVTVPLITTLLSSTALLAVVPASMLTTTGTLSLFVENPAPGGDSATTDVAVANLPIIYGIVNAASYSAISVCPGELVTVFGSNIGPTTPSSLIVSNGFVDSAALGGVSITVDGVAAPMIYAGLGQVTFQIPYEATTGPGKQVLLTNGANPGVGILVTINSTAPGIFSANGSGIGQAAALNLNVSGQLSLNGAANMAKAGDTVVLYVTGEGDYNSTHFSGPSNTGFIVPATLSPLPQLNPLPTVRIGGVDASAGVAYAGPIPGSMLGLLQINVVVPAGSTTGVAVPVLVNIGGNDSQAGVTLAVHP